VVCAVVERRLSLAADGPISRDVAYEVFLRKRGSQAVGLDVNPREEPRGPLDCSGDHGLLASGARELDGAS
jgi:hypothetical protein